MKAAKHFLALIFVMILSLGVQAQDKFEYANIVYQAGLKGNYDMYATVDGNYSETKGKVDQGAAYYNLSPVIDLINKMAKEGWELQSTNIMSLGVGIGNYYYLRKKKS